MNREPNIHSFVEYDYIIVGGGCFGLHTAFFLSELEFKTKKQHPKILILDPNTTINSTTHSGLGTLKYAPDTSPAKLWSLRKSFEFKGIDLSWLPYFLYENAFNMANNREMMIKLSKYSEKLSYFYNLTNEDNYTQCEEQKTSYYHKNYFKNLKKRLLLTKNVVFLPEKVLNYKIIDTYNDGYRVNTDKNIFTCNKLILTPGTALNKLLPKQSNAYNIIRPVNGYSVDLELNNKTTMPDCFYMNGNTFITPLDKEKHHIRVTCKIIIGEEETSEYLPLNTENNSKINKELQNVLELLKENGITWKRIIRVWKGSRPMTYDSLPFINKEATNLYSMSGGSFIGTHFSATYAYWMAQYVLYGDISKNTLINNFNPFLSRLINIRSNLSKNVILLTLIIFYLLKRFKSL